MRPRLSDLQKPSPPIHPPQDDVPADDPGQGVPQGRHVGRQPRCEQILVDHGLQGAAADLDVGQRHGQNAATDEDSNGVETVDDERLSGLPVPLDVEEPIAKAQTTHGLAGREDGVRARPDRLVEREEPAPDVTGDHQNSATHEQTRHLLDRFQLRRDQEPGENTEKRRRQGGDGGEDALRIVDLGADPEMIVEDRPIEPAG